MKYRPLGRTGYDVSTISFGAWAIGGAWGRTDDTASMAALNRALDVGINFFDTADVYGDGHSERLLARLRRERKDPFYVATKAGRRLDPHTAAGYNPKNLTAFVERSLKNLETSAIDLLQLHCPPPAVYYMPEVFGVVDDLVKQGKVRFYGVSVEKVEEGLMALEYPNVQSVQIVYNMFRQRPADLFLPEAKRRNVGVLARLPLSSGILSGTMTPKTTFEADDHRSFNRLGEAFDVGETFSGVDFDGALAAVEELRTLVPRGVTMAEWALAWVVTSDAVTCAIPGARRTDQVDQNARAAELAPLPDATMQKIRAIYESRIKSQVHHRW
jgi:aryl-alcohol dehydrogenase-like predicted oxidoreductase